MPARKLTFSVTFVIEKDEDGYHAFCPNLKGLHTCGRTRAEALENAKHAVEAYINSLLMHNEPIPLSCRHEPIEEPRPQKRPAFSTVEVAV